MPLDLHPQLKNVIIKNLKCILPNLDMITGIGLSSESRNLLGELDSCLPGHGPVANKLKSWISDQPLSDFIVGQINISSMEDIFEVGGSRPLTSLEKWSDVDTIAQNLIEQFDNLPYEYTFSIQAPTGFELIFDDNIQFIEISNHIKILLANNSLNEKFPLLSGNDQIDNKVWDRQGIASVFKLERTNYEWEGVYLQISTHGFVGRFLETATEHLALSEFKAFWGLHLALGSIKRTRSWSPSPKPIKAIIHRFINADQNLLFRIELDATTSALAHDISFNDWVLSDFPKDMKLDFYRKNISRVGTAFEPGAEAARIRLACCWLFDSYATDNELLAYVQAMVCLEIVLGDSSLIGEIGLGELLRNRCAYLIGKTSTQRNEILKDFKEIYDVRSHIVHRGKDRMSAREREHYAKLIWYCRRCIDEELKLLEEAAKAK